MNKKQKILTIVMLPIFLGTGLFFGGADGFAAAFTGWFVVGVVYAAVFFLLKPSRPN